MSQEIQEHRKVTIRKWDKILQIAPLRRVTEIKTFLCIWTTRIVPSKGAFTISKQNIDFLLGIVERQTDNLSDKEN